MKTRRPLLLLAAAMCPATLFLASGCSKTDDPKTSMRDAKASAEKAVADMKVAVSDTWDSIKDFTYEKRADLSARIDRMSRDLDARTAALTARVAGVPDATSADRVRAMKEYDEARAELKARLADLGNASAHTWAEAKARAAVAWKNMQAACDRVTKADAAP